jgi:hypothetical protein
MTATHEYIIRPITAKFNVDGILATDLARENGKITGIMAGTPCFQQGKVTRLLHWLVQNPDHNPDDRVKGPDNKADIRAMLDAGWDDGEVLEINQVTAYFNYANRTVLGLGINTEGDIIGLSPGYAADIDNWNHA